MPSHPLPDGGAELKRRAQALRTAALVCASLSLFIVIHAVNTAWPPEQKWVGLRFLLLSGGILLFWGWVLFRSHRVCRGEAASLKLMPLWAGILLGAAVLGLILWPNP